MKDKVHDFDVYIQMLCVVLFLCFTVLLESDNS